MTMRIAPSILNADLADIAAEVARVPSSDMIHFDVMDNHFVPNLTLGLPVVESLLRHTTTPIDAHLMIEDADTWAPQYADLGCESVTFHAEATKAPIRLAREIRKLGSRASLALKPTTSIEPYAEVIGEFDMILLMTVEPGFGGQSFLDSVLPKIRRTRGLIQDTGKQIWIQVDGGVSVDTIGRAAEAGADVFVAGTAVYRSDDPDAMVTKLRDLAVSACGH
ncbi:ribulose-phosphate 3-epimerase [Propionimicrobium sp. PCR01-08-3]|uniref:ribulose-phosphate 3-epimerase n=1 Tax=Propionimicrobium sp. PCR01-08-3 TaxID=3052086 RepID=UPI00255C5A32|nr:ribulose-phosphate 3-epimerase [Propionimicrobium sp. PCR01-08-3]WIY83909.1 ribulose-phosphate 3-epimerase [Propionimicrobium sp. PCR01-08-3]